jgi:hypothetical protein
VRRHTRVRRWRSRIIPFATEARTHRRFRRTSNCEGDRRHPNNPARNPNHAELDCDLRTNTYNPRKCGKDASLMRRRATEERPFSQPFVRFPNVAFCEFRRLLACLRVGTKFAANPGMRGLGCVTGLVILLATAISCSGDSDDGWADAPLLPPVLMGISPSEIQLGEVIKVTGADFPHPDKGKMELRLVGNYVGAGFSHAYDGTFPVLVKNPRMAEFTMEEILFHPTRDKLGIFYGQAQLITRPLHAPKDDAVQGLLSNPVDQTLNVLPTVIVKTLRAYGHNCTKPVQWMTNPGMDLEIDLQAIGLGVATAQTGWVWEVFTNSSSIRARFVAEDVLPSGASAFVRVPFTNMTLPPIRPDIEAEPEGDVTFSVTSYQGDRMVVSPGQENLRVAASPPVRFGFGERSSNLVLSRFFTNDIETPEEMAARGAANEREIPGYAAPIRVVVSTADGRRLSRQINFEVRQRWSTGHYDGNAQVVEVQAAQDVTACTPVGDFLLTVTYDESVSMSRARHRSFRRDYQNNFNGGFSAGPLSMFQVHNPGAWTDTFGVDVQETVTSEQRIGKNIQKQVPPSWAYQMRRQARRVRRVVPVIETTACGEQGPVLSAALYDWQFAQVIDTGPTCPIATELPPSTPPWRPDVSVAEVEDNQFPDRPANQN